MNQDAKVIQSNIVDPTPLRKKRLIEVVYRFLNDKGSLAEMKGLKRSDLYQLAETGHIKFRHGRIGEAEKIFQGLIILDHRNHYFHAMMGAVHQKQNRPVEAIMEYSQALKINQNDIASLVNRGEIYLRHRNYRKAAEDFRQAILLDERGSNPWANRARSLVIALRCSLESDRKLSKKH